MPVLSEAKHYIAKALTGEVGDVLQSALDSVCPNMNVKSLIPVPGRNNSIDYLHPHLKDVIISYDMQPERTRQITRRTRWGYKYREQETTPARFSYTVYSGEGHIASIIKGQFLRLSETDKLPYATEIKDFYPPSKRRANEKEVHDEDIKRIIAIKRRAARAFKLSQRENGVLQHIEPVNGFAYRSVPPIHTNGNGRTTHVYGFNGNGLACEDKRARKIQSLIAAKGPIRRERTFKALSLSDRYYGRLSTDQFVLKSRSIKDRINHLDDTYIVLQFTGKTYSATHYSAEGARIKLTSYNSEGEALKELGSNHRSATLRKLRRSSPPDKVIKGKLLLAATERDIPIDAIQGEPEPAYPMARASAAGAETALTLE